MHRLHINVSCWMRGYYSSWDGTLRAEEYDIAVLERKVSERDSAVILKKTYWAITLSRWGKFSPCQKRTLHCKLLSVELLKDTEAKVCAKEALLTCWPVFFPFSALHTSEQWLLGLVSGDQCH